MLRKILKRFSEVKITGFKRYAENTGYLLFEKVARTVFMITVWAYVARYLGPDQFGLLNYALSFIFLFNVFAELGLESIVVRELVKGGQKESVVLGSAFFLRMVGGLAAILVILITTSLMSLDWQTKCVILAVSARLLFYCFRVIDFDFQARVQSRFTVFASLLSLVAVTVLCFVFAYLKLPLIYFASLVVIEMLVVSIGYVVFYHTCGGKMTSWRIEGGEVKRLLKDSWPIMLSTAAVAVYMRIDQIMIKEMLGTVELGYYSGAVRISEAFFFIPMILTGSLFPAIINARIKDRDLYRQRIKKLFAFLFWASFFIAIGISLTAEKLLLLLFGEEYLPALEALRIHVWSGIFVFMGVGVGKWLVSENLQIYSMFYTVAGAIANIMLNLILIPQYGITGAAVATVISKALVGFLLNAAHPKTREAFFLQLESMKSNPLFFWVR